MLSHCNFLRKNICKGIPLIHSFIWPMFTEPAIDLVLFLDTGNPAGNKRKSLLSLSIYSFECGGSDPKKSKEMYTTPVSTQCQEEK